MLIYISSRVECLIFNNCKRTYCSSTLISSSGFHPFNNHCCGFELNLVTMRTKTYNENENSTKSHKLKKWRGDWRARLSVFAMEIILQVENVWAIHVHEIFQITYVVKNPICVKAKVTTLSVSSWKRGCSLMDKNVSYIVNIVRPYFLFFFTISLYHIYIFYHCGVSCLAKRFRSFHPLFAANVVFCLKLTFSLTRCRPRV